MKKHGIIIRLGPNDKVLIKPSDKMQVMTEVPFLDETLSYEKRIKHEDIFSELKRFCIQPSEIAMDMLVLAIAVFAADIRISRENDSQDSWTREIELYLPVSDLALWQKQKFLIEKLLRFLTGDIWTMSFRDRPNDLDTLSPIYDKKVEPVHDTVSLFSGGLDSFVGAIDSIEKGLNPILLGHHKSPDVAAPQIRCFEYLESKYPTKKPEFINIYLNVPKELFGGVQEKTERSRSFLFLSLGIVFASALSKRSKLIVAENGLIALNVPLTSLRLGSLSTRTTHPFYMARMQDLVNSLGLGVNIVNPYLLQTKGEMLSNCLNQSVLKEFAHNTMSCAHPTAGRYRGVKIGHCGECVPCIIRKASFYAAYGKGSDTTRYNKKTFNPRNKDIVAFRSALLRITANPKIADVLIYKPGPLLDVGDIIGSLVDVYKRGMDEVGSLFSEFKTKFK